MNKCTKCGAETVGAFCPNCGAPVMAQPTPQPAPQPTPQPVQRTVYQAAPQPAPQPAPTVNNYIRTSVGEEDLPAKYKPLSPWAYFGLNLLYSIPIVGLIFLLIHTFSSGNINRRNHARGYWCAILVCAIIGVFVAIILLIICLVMGVSLSELIKQTSNYSY